MENTKTMYAIEIKNLTKKYKEFEALKNISFKIEKGDFFGFIGPNGAGKTTTINSIIGLVKYNGSIKAFGFDAVKNYRETREKIGLSPQEYNFDRFLTVEKCLSYTAGYFGIQKEDAEKRTYKLLKKFNLYSKRNNTPMELSGGMKRRLMIARALIHKPEILILDEPTAGIDVQLRRELWDLMKEINNEGTTIILTSHYIEEVEALCKTICVINKGRIIEIGKKSKIMKDLSNQTLQIKTDKRIPNNLIDHKDLAISNKNGIIRITGKEIKKDANNIIKKIENAGIKIKEIDLKNERLEEVFLRLTGEKK